MYHLCVKKCGTQFVYILLPPFSLPWTHIIWPAIGHKRNRGTRHSARSRCVLSSPPFTRSLRTSDRLSSTASSNHPGPSAAAAGGQLLLRRFFGPVLPAAPQSFPGSAGRRGTTKTPSTVSRVQTIIMLLFSVWQNNNTTMMITTMHVIVVALYRRQQCCGGGGRPNEILL